MFVEMSETRWINEDLFLDWLKLLFKFKSESKIFLILDTHESHVSYETIRFHKDESLKAKYHKYAMEWTHKNPTAAINKFRYSSFFAEHTTKRRMWEQLSKVSCAQE
jgi:hypothetical protein